MPGFPSTHRIPLDEFQIITHLRRRFGQIAPSVAHGIGDDAAVVTPKKGRQIVLTTDLLVEGVHFDLKTATLGDIGYKSAVANLSDIAAMGALPDYALVCLAIPPTLTHGDIDRFYRGFMLANRRYGVHLIGGDTSASQRDLFVNVTLVGHVATGRALTRQGARVGDLVYVTGTLGDSLAGLTLLSDRKKSLPSSTRDRLMRRHFRPTPRLELGHTLSAHRLATSAIDVSDGLSGDIRHICLQSQVGVELDARTLPLSSELRTYARSCARNPIDMALQGGEDYELLFTVSPRNQAQLIQRCDRIACRLSRIGVIRPQTFGLRVRDETDRLRRLPTLSYRHFQPLSSRRAVS